MKTIRVLLADDHTLVRAGIRSLLEKMRGVEVVGEAADGQEALNLVQEFKPDVAVMDIGMPGLNGLEATARVTREFPAVRVLILSMHSQEEYVLQALRAGASGYLLKRSAAGQLGIAIRTVARRETYLCPGIAEKVASVGQKLLATRQIPLSPLTKRQRQILQMIAEGKTMKEVAFLLNVSAKTAEFHRAQLMRRLKIHDVPGLVRYAVRTGIVPLEADSHD